MKLESTLVGRLIAMGVRSGRRVAAPEASVRYAEGFDFYHAYSHFFFLRNLYTAHKLLQEMHTVTTKNSICVRDNNPR
jgi:hypothetical protein